MTLFQFSYLLLWALAIVLIPIAVVLLYLLAQLKSQVGREGIGLGNNLIGRNVPGFSATDTATGVTRDIRGIFPGQDHVILAVSPTCGSCLSLISEINSMSSDELPDIRLVVLCMGLLADCQSAVADVKTVPCLVHDLNMRTDVSMDVWFSGFPAALIVDDSGFIIDLRHPISIKGMVAAIKNARLRDRSLSYQHGAP